MTTELSSYLSTAQRSQTPRYPATGGGEERVKSTALSTLKSLTQPDDKIDLSGESDAASDIYENPEVQRYSREKNQALEAFERLKEELKIVRKVWANDPEELAAQLVRLGKQLAKLVKQYQKAQKAMADILGKASGGALTMPSLSMPVTTAAGAPETEAKTASSDMPNEQDIPAEADMSEDLPEDAIEDVPEEAAAPPVQSDGLATYQKMTGKRVRLDQTPFATELRFDIQYAHGFREFATELRLELEYSQKKAPAMPGHSEAREEYMEDAHDFLKDLEKELFKYEGELKRAMPPAIYVTVQA